MSGTRESDRQQRPDSGRPAEGPTTAIPPLPSTLNTREARRANAELTPVKPRAVTGKKAKRSPAPSTKPSVAEESLYPEPAYKRKGSLPAEAETEPVEARPFFPASSATDESTPVPAALPASQAVNAFTSPRGEHNEPQPFRRLLPPDEGDALPEAPTVALLSADEDDTLSETPTVTLLSRDGIDALPETPVASSLSKSPGMPMPRRKDMNRFITVGVVALAVISLVTAGLLVWNKSQNPTIEQSMFASYQSQQTELKTAAAAVTTDIEAFTTRRDELTLLNTEAAAALMSVTGFADEPARLLAEAARVEFETSLAAQAAPVIEADLEAPKTTLSADSSVDALASGINGLNTVAQRIEDDAQAADDALAALESTRTTFVTALATFAATIPATATALIDTNSDAAASFTDAVTSSVANLTAKIEAGLAGVAELQGYATAAAALTAEQARLDAIVPVAPDRDDERTPPTTPRTRQTVAPAPPVVEDPGTGTPVTPDPSPSADPEPSPDTEAPVE